jgi:hypothetical protein
MARWRVLSSRTRSVTVPPSGRRCRDHSSGGCRTARLRSSPYCDPSGGAGDDPTGGAQGRSVRSGQCQHLRPFALRQATPDPVGLVDLQRVGPAGCHCRALETHGLRLGLAPGSGRPALALRMEEEGTCHPPAGCVQLPVPQISIRAGQAPGVSHVDPFCSDQICSNQICSNQICSDHNWSNQNRSDRNCSDQNGGHRPRNDQGRCNARLGGQRCRNRRCPNRGGGAENVVQPTPRGIGARSAARSNQTGVILVDATGINLVGVSRWGRIRADPGAVDLQTLDRFSSRDKTLITIIVDLGEGCPKVVGGGGSGTPGQGSCGVAHISTQHAHDVRQWRMSPMRLLSAVRVETVAGECPKNPLWGSYRRVTGTQGFGSPAVAPSQPASISSAGGVT